MYVLAYLIDLLLSFSAAMVTGMDPRRQERRAIFLDADLCPHFVAFYFVNRSGTITMRCCYALLSNLKE
jgi:hypothetical protein